MSTALLTMTKKSFGCIGVINSKNQIMGIITDGDLRRKLNSKFFEKTASEIMKLLHMRNQNRFKQKKRFEKKKTQPQN